MASAVNLPKRNLRIFLAIVILLTIIGLVFVYSSSSVFALEKFGASNYFLKKQILYLQYNILIT